MFLIDICNIKYTTPKMQPLTRLPILGLKSQAKSNYTELENMKFPMRTPRTRYPQSAFTDMRQYTTNCISIEPVSITLERKSNIIISYSPHKVRIKNHSVLNFKLPQTKCYYRGPIRQYTGAM